MLAVKSTSKQVIIVPEGIDSELRDMGRDKFLICPAFEGNVYFGSGSFTPPSVHYQAKSARGFSEPEVQGSLSR